MKKINANIQMDTNKTNNTNIRIANGCSIGIIRMNSYIGIAS